MNKSIKSVLAAIIIILIMIPCTTYAQDDNGNNTVLVVKYETKYHDDFSYAKLDSLNELYDTNVVKKINTLSVQWF